MSRHFWWALPLGAAALTMLACRPSAGTATSPVNPTPVGAPTPGTTPPPDRTDRAGAAGGGDARDDSDTLPIRPTQAPIVTVRQILVGNIAIGRRVRVSGRCLDATAGHSAGLWTLAADSGQIEVRGLVPKPCPTKLGQTVTIFAQVEWKTSGGPDRLLLRLPGQ